MKESIRQEENLNYWEDQAGRFKSHAVSWWDINMKRIEINNIIPFLSKHDSVMDIGCSNGASTFEINKRVGCRIHGIDYSTKAINEANKNKNKNVTFEVGDIVEYKSRVKYDKALTIRCLINIMSKTGQQKALINIYELLKDKGIFIMAEAFSGGLKNLNKARNLFKLKPLAVPVFNNYLNEGDFEKFITKYFSIIEIKKYASLYYIGTRLFQYLALDEDPNKKDTPLHRFFANYDCETKRSGDFSPQKIYVLQKK